MTPKVRYDPDANAAYINLSASQTLESEEVLPGVILDFDESGRIVGIEVLRAREQLPADTLAMADGAKGAKTEPVS